MTSRLPLILLFVCSLCHARTRTGVLIYPLKHNINLEEGTLECWVRLHFEPADVLPKQEFHGLLSLLSLSGDRGGVNMSYFAGSVFRPEAGWQVRLSPQSDLLPLGKRVVWKRDEWHHLAFIWKGKDTWLYVDGKSESHRTHPVTFATGVGGLGGKNALPNWPFFFGDRWNVGAKMSLDDVRLSLVARRPEELGFQCGKLASDPFTSLLDSFDSPFKPDNKRNTRPTVIHDGEGGLVTTLCQFTKGKFGHALSLVIEPNNTLLTHTDSLEKVADEADIQWPQTPEPTQSWRLFPTVGIPRISDPPVIDGMVETREWFASLRLGALVDDEQGEASRLNSSVRLAWNDAGLFVAFEFERPRHDLRPGQGDYFEAVLYTEDGNAHRSYRVSVHGSVGGPTNVPTQCKTSTTNNGWAGEMLIPTELLVDDRTSLRMNFIRHDTSPGLRTWRWVYPGRTGSQLPKGGVIHFIDAPISVVLQAGWLPLYREVGIKALIANFASTPISVDGFARLRRATDVPAFLPALHDAVTDDLGQSRNVSVDEIVDDGLLAKHQTVVSRQSSVVVPANTSTLFLATAPDTPGRYVCELRMKHGNQILSECLVPTTVPDHLGIRISTFLLSSAVEYNADLRRLADALGEDSTLELSLHGPDNTVVASRAVRDLTGVEHVKGAFRLPLTHSASYRLDATIHNGDTELAKRSVLAKTAARSELPDWWLMDEGNTPLIPPPWTPLNATLETADVLGRRYTFDAMALPSQISTRGKEILAGPIRVQSSHDWKSQGLRLVDSKPDAAVYENTFTDAGRRILVRTRLEFDGFMLVDLFFDGTGKLNDLEIVIPFKAEHAKLLQNYRVAPGPGTKVSRFTGEIPQDGYKSPPMITTWIGTDHYGLEFSCESSRGWSMAKPDEAMQVRRNGDRVELHIGFITRPISLSSKARHIRFGLVATPTKTVLPHIKNARFYDDVHVALLPIDWSGTPAWHAPMKDEARIAKSRAWVESVHQRNQKLLVNGGWAISVQDEANAPWVHEMFSEPKRNVSYSSARQFAYCYNTPYAKFLANSFAHNARLLGFDGIRFDTVTPGYTCSSPAHGCGWRDDDGNLWPSFSIFSQREIWKHIYRTFHGGVVKEGVVYTPNAAGPIMAVHSFSDHHEIGEGFYQKAKDLKSGYPPGMVRTTMTGDAYGLATCSNLKMGPLFYNERIAALLVNGAEPRFHDYRHWRVGYAAHANPAASIWDAWKWVDRYDAEWLGWWENKDLVRVDAEGQMVLASLHAQRGRKALLVVTNYEKEPIDDLVTTLELKKLGFTGKVFGEDAITSQPIPISNAGEMRLDLFGQRYRLVKISPDTPPYTESRLSRPLSTGAPQQLQKSWLSQPIALQPDTDYVVEAQVKIDQAMGRESANPNSMGRFSPSVRHYVSITLSGKNVFGVNGTNRRGSNEKYELTDNYKRSFAPMWWEKTPGWATMFVPVRTGPESANAKVAVSITDPGQATVRDITVRKVLRQAP